MGNQGDAYFVWLKTKGSLEELCQNKDNYAKIAKSDQIASEQFAQLQERLIQYRTSINNIAPNSTYLGSSQQETLTQASVSLEELTTILELRYIEIAKHEPQIRRAIQHYQTISAPLAKDKYFCQIIAATQEYAELKHFDHQLIEPKEPRNELYIALSQLSLFASPHARRNYFTQIQSATSLNEIEKIHSKIKDDVRSEEIIRLNLNHTFPSKSIPQTHSSFITTSTPFYQLINNQLQRIILEPSSYFEYVQNIKSAIENLDEQKKTLTTSPISLSTSYVEKLASPPNVSSSPFEDVLFMKPLLDKYNTKRMELQDVAQLKKQDIAQCIENKIKATHESINKYNLPANQTEENARQLLCQVEDMQNCQQIVTTYPGIAKKESVAKINAICRTLRSLDAYLSLDASKSEQPPCSLTLENEEIVTKRTTFQPEEGQVIKQKNTSIPQPSVELKHDVSQNYSPIMSTKIPQEEDRLGDTLQFTTPLDTRTILYAFQSINQVTDKNVKVLCEQVSGYAGNILSLDYISKPKQVTLPIIDTTKLNSQDIVIYKQLKTFLHLV